VKTTVGRIGTVLVVDDDALFCKSLKRALMSDNRRALTATRPAEAQEIIGCEHIDLVLIDLVLRGSSGIDLLLDITRDHPAVVVIMMSGLFSKQSVMRAFRAGAYDCVDKPFDVRALLHAVEHGVRVVERDLDEIPTPDEAERDYYNGLIDVCGGNVTQAAEHVGLHRTTLQRIRRRLKSDAQGERPGRSASTAGGDVPTISVEKDVSVSHAAASAVTLARPRRRDGS
jgi:DNA-binding NtrC family response regulator